MTDYTNRFNEAYTELQKAIKNYSHLTKVPVVDKNGHTRMVYKDMNKDNNHIVEKVKKINNESMNKTPFKTEEEKREFGIALYTLNKEAKRIRDIKRDLFEYNNGGYGTEEIANLVNLSYEDDEICGFTEEEKKLKSLNEANSYAHDCWKDMYEAKDRMDKYGDEDSEDYDEDEYDDAEYDYDYYKAEYESAKKIAAKFEKLSTTSVKNTDEGYKIVGKQNDVMDKLKLQEEAIYDLKDKVLQKLKPEIIAYHQFNDDEIRPLYKVGDFTFHGIQVENVPKNTKVEKLNTISAENKLNDSEKISIDEAEKIVKKYL